MENVESNRAVQNGPAKPVKAVKLRAKNTERRIRQRVDQAREMMEEARDRAEIALKEQPYLLPVAAGAVGLGVGVLIGSKITRLFLLAAAGVFVNDLMGGELKQIAKSFMEDMKGRLAEEELEGEHV